MENRSGLICSRILLCAVELVFAAEIMDAGAASRDVRYRVINLSANLSNIFTALSVDVNQRGDVVGTYSSKVDSNWYGFVYTDSDGLFEVGKAPEGVCCASIGGINDLGIWSATAPTNSGGLRVLYRHSPESGWALLGNDTGRDIAVGKINNFGQIAVSTQDPRHAFRYTDGIGFEDLGELFPGGTASAYAINDAGSVTGWARRLTNEPTHAFLYNGGTGMVDLGEGIGRAINNRGVVAGFIGNASVGMEACLFENATIRRLGNSGRGSFATAINNFEVVVGETIMSYPAGHSVPFIWCSAEGMRDLSDFLPDGWMIGGVLGVIGGDVGRINDAGQIAAQARLDDGRSEAVRLDPIPPTLAINWTGTNIAISWSPAWPGIVLESSESLTAPDWQTMDTGATNVVGLLPTGQTRFFRINPEGIRGLCCAADSP